MNYWAAETSNLADCHEPLIDLVADLADAGRRTARDFYGCRGWVAHHNVDIWRSTWPTGQHEAHPYWVNWQMGAPWLCQHLWEHYLFSGETAPDERDYRVMREAAIFLLDYLVKGPTTSWLPARPHHLRTLFELRTAPKPPSARRRPWTFG